jgi:Bacterial extracellular solute-binding protein
MSSKSLVCFPLFLLFQMTAHPVAAAPKPALEIFSYWTSGSEAAALNALLDLYKAQNPGVEIVNATVAGGNGSAALPVLQARLLGGNPPDTWQTHPGSELFNRYVAAGKCEPLTELYASEGWLKVVPGSKIEGFLYEDEGDGFGEHRITRVLGEVRNGQIMIRRFAEGGLPSIRESEEIHLLGLERAASIEGSLSQQFRGNKLVIQMPVDWTELKVSTEAREQA